MSKVLNSDFRGNPNLNWLKKDIKILKLRVKNSDNQNYKYAYIFFGIFKCYEKFKHTGEVVEEEGWGGGRFFFPGVQSIYFHIYGPYRFTVETKTIAHVDAVPYKSNS